MTTATNSCPQCGAETEPAFRTDDQNRRLGKGPFSYRRCRGCGLIYLENVPADLHRYYPQDYYFIARSLQELAAWGNHERYKLDIVSQFRRSGRLIEVGPASGAFAYLAKTSGFDVTAIEMDERCSRYLSEQAGLHVIHSADEAKALETAPPADVIAMWHVIEHLVDPWSMLEVAAAKLKPGGILVLAAPNPAAVQLGIFGGRWVHVDAPRHLWLIPPKVLAKRGEKAGLRQRLLTTRDPGSLFWNRFGWQYTLANGFGLPHRLAQLASYPLTLAAALFERREGRGSAYTLVMEKAA
jgi:2-polyprenyl-3-methyl-5-hydroxy-6-metoxy-1,4-benzoquinol methylase